LLAQIIHLLTTPPGNLVYHLVLAFSVITGLQAIALSGENRQRARRLMLTLMVVLVGQMALFVSSGLVWQGLADPQVFLPPLDRAVLTLSLLWIVWVWAFPEPNRVVDTILSVLSMAGVIFFLVTLSGWAQLSGVTSFNASPFDSAWTITGMAIGLAGILAILLRRPEDWGVGLGFVLIHLAGFVAHWLISPLDQDFAGTIRLAQVATYPLLPTLARRLRSAPAELVDLAAGAAASERKRYSADARTVNAWLEVAAAQQPEKSAPALLKAVAQTMLADLCFFLIAEPNSNDVQIAGGYDLIREENFTGKVFPANRIPLVANALQRGRPIRLLAEGTIPEDLESFVLLLNMKDPGHLLAVPLTIPGASWAGIVLLSPYSNRSWSPEDQSYLLSTADRLSQILTRPAGGQPAAAGESALQQELARTRAQLDKLQGEYQQSLARLKDRTEPLTAQASDEIKGLLAVQQEATETVARLERENKQLRTSLQLLSTGASATRTTTSSEELAGELKLTLQEVAHLRNELAEAQRQTLDLQSRIAHSVTDEEREVLTSITQELRQPLSSIMGYTDLLLGESVGILGALQQKFLEKIKASGDRMKVLLDDMLQLTHLETETNELVLQQVDLNHTMDQIMTEMRTQLRERKINLRVDIPDDLPTLVSDPESIQQILLHLLHNAREVSPVDGTVIVQAREDRRDPQHPHILVQVTDFGGGVPKDDLPRVFTRIYRADHPLIPGIGDSGVGLSIAKTLVEAQGGRIWVETEPERSTTFNVLLPVRSANGKGNLPA
jgi:signal transduction histidine kinase